MKQKTTQLILVLLMAVLAPLAAEAQAYTIDGTNVPGKAFLNKGLDQGDFNKRVMSRLAKQTAADRYMKGDVKAAKDPELRMRAEKMAGNIKMASRNAQPRAAIKSSGKRMAPAIITEQPEGTLYQYYRTDGACIHNSVWGIAISEMDGKMKVVFDATSDDVYIKNFSWYFNNHNAWVKGTYDKESGIITVPTGQYLDWYETSEYGLQVMWGRTLVEGEEGDYHLVRELDETVTEIQFQIDGEMIKLLGSKGDFNAEFPQNYVAEGIYIMYSDDNTMAALEFGTVGKFYEIKPAIPANPTADEWYDSGDESGFSKFYFTLPTTDVNGNSIDPEYLSYSIFTDDNGVFTFSGYDYSFDLELDETITEVPYALYSNAVDFHDNYCYIYHTNADGYEPFFEERIGIQVYYTVDGVKNSSNIVWLYPYGGIPINEKNFPDENFRNYLLTLDHETPATGDPYFTRDQINAITKIDVFKKGIEDLTGIGYFTSLTGLNCRSNQLTSLDLSANTALTRLDCSDNQLTTLDLSQNTALTELSCTINQLTTLDLTQNTSLTLLFCSNNQLTTLDVSQNTALTELYCHFNELTSLDLSQNTALTTLTCFNNQLTSLNVSQNTALDYLNCSNNQLTTLDVLQNTSLTLLYCFKNQLTTLDVSQNTELTTLSCFSNKLTELNVSENKALTTLYCYSNQIGIKAMGALVESLPTVESGKFYVVDTNDENEGNLITKAQVQQAKDKGWSVLDADGNDYPGVIPIDETTFPDENFRNWVLAQDYGQDGALTDEEIASVTSMDVSGQGIKDLTGIEFFTELTDLNCSDNELTSLDVSQNTALTTLDCSNNQLTELDVTANTALTWLACYNNQISEEAMEALVESLPTVDAGQLYVINPEDENEGNVINNDQIEKANDKGWEVLDASGLDYEADFFDIALLDIIAPDEVNLDSDEPALVTVIVKNISKGKYMKIEDIVVHLYVDGEEATVSKSISLYKSGEAHFHLAIPTDMLTSSFVTLQAEVTASIDENPDNNWSEEVDVMVVGLTTSIAALKAKYGDDIVVYTLDGKKVDVSQGLKKGIYLINGKKVVTK